MLPTRPFLVALIVFAVLGLSHVPCADAGDAKLDGKIVVDNKPLPAGKVTFHAATGQFVGCLVQKDGSYTIDRVPAGTYKITIEGKGVPPRYSLPETTALTLEVKDGKHTHDIVLAK